MNTGLRLSLLWIKLCTKRQIHQSATESRSISDRCSDIDLNVPIEEYPGRCSSMPICKGRKVSRIIGRILLTPAVFEEVGGKTSLLEDFSVSALAARSG